MRIVWSCMPTAAPTRHGAPDARLTLVRGAIGESAAQCSVIQTALLSIR